MSNQPVIAVIGAGNMGSSLVHGLINTGFPADKLWASDPNPDILSALEQRYHIHTHTDNLKAIAAAEVIIFAVKPQVFAQVAKEMALYITQQKPLVISIAAGIRITSIQRWLDNYGCIIRVMPNTPALIGCGASALYAQPGVTAKQRDIAESILRTVGVIVWLANEELMDTVTALSGNGPAYFFLVMEILQQVAEKLGLPTETARLLTLETALGAARLAIESGKSLAELRQNVTSPGGTTERALSVLEENHIRTLFEKALRAGKSRAEELAEIMG